MIGGKSEKFDFHRFSTDNRLFRIAQVSTACNWFIPMEYNKHRQSDCFDRLTSAQSD